MKEVRLGKYPYEDLFEGMTFDVIATNPPHMKQDEFSFIRESSKPSSPSPTILTSTRYYAERAFGPHRRRRGSRILMSNRWMRPAYGADCAASSLRKTLPRSSTMRTYPGEGTHTPLSIVAGANELTSEALR